MRCNDDVAVCFFGLETTQPLTNKSSRSPFAFLTQLVKVRLVISVLQNTTTQQKTCCVIYLFASSAVCAHRVHSMHLDLCAS